MPVRVVLSTTHSTISPNHNRFRVLVYSNATDQVNSLVYDGFVEEIVNTLELSDDVKKLSVCVVRNGYLVVSRSHSKFTRTSFACWLCSGMSRLG